MDERFYVADERFYETDEERRRRRRALIERMKREKKRALFLQRVVFPAGMALLVAVIVIGILVRGRADAGQGDRAMDMTVAGQTGGWSAIRQWMELENEQAAAGSGDNAQFPADTAPGEVQPTTARPAPKLFQAVETGSTAGFADTIVSEYGVVIDVEQGVILAEKDARTKMSPASMTKILTVLTAAEALGITRENWGTLPVLDEKFTITIEITDYCFVNGCSNVGFEVGEEVTVRDLFYGTILSSGADAALGLACYVAGSHEDFVGLMNEKLSAMGLADTTHFTNCVGIYDKDHYSTAYDIAVILKMASDNPFCRAVLSTHTYNIPSTNAHPEGMSISNWFLRRIEEKDTHGRVLCGKTGYVKQSRSCAASLATDENGREYICVTAGSSGTKQCISDHAELYQTWLPGGN